jgi:hypothetical protein
MFRKKIVIILSYRGTFIGARSPKSKAPKFAEVASCTNAIWFQDERKRVVLRIVND